MVTFNIGKKYSTTYSIKKAAKGWEFDGQIWKNDKPTGIRFSGTGKTRQNAVNNASRKALEVCPDD